MFVYNITITIDPAIETAWVNWQTKEHIPDVMASGQFIDYKFYRLLEQNETDGITYVIQYFSSSIDHYNTYAEAFSPALHQKAFDKWGNQFIAFRTIMQSVD